MVARQPIVPASKRSGRRRVPYGVNVILLGGSSHAGKSTLARALADAMGGEVLSTDTLARHPGRPWGEVGRRPHVIEHYLTLSVEELLEDVLRHYRENVWPQVVEAIESASGPLVIEGSALWPESVATLQREGVSAVFLTASDDLFRRRIHAESRFDELAGSERELVEKFLARTLLYNRRMNEEVRRLGLESRDVEEFSPPGEFLESYWKRLDRKL
jgi:shikimate kinase